MDEDPAGECNLCLYLSFKIGQFFLQPSMVALYMQPDMAAPEA